MLLTADASVGCDVKESAEAVVAEFGRGLGCHSLAARIVA
jgi:hypothetical protein